MRERRFVRQRTEIAQLADYPVGSRARRQAAQTNFFPMTQPTAAKILPGFRVAMVLQGGGALGAYQGGVYQALHEHGMTPDWVVGTSIGAINGAIIAGNRHASRLTRLQEFWESISHPDFFDMHQVPDAIRQLNTRFSTLKSSIWGVPGFYVPRPFNPFAAGLPVDPERASYYDTTPLAGTLQRFVDFDFLNAKDAMRLSVGAMQVTTGELINFDNSTQTIGPEHIMASGALPPGFPPVRIDGELYWDGGLYSNTPLEVVLDDEPRQNTLCFMVDLWRSEGPEPRTLEESYTRQRDVLLASRSNRHIDEYRRMHNLRNVVCNLHERLPADMVNQPEVREMAALGCNTTMHIVRLAYGGQDWQMANKHINFSSGSIHWRWEKGYEDGLRAIEQAGWMQPHSPLVGVVVHDLIPAPRQEQHD
ncbi:MAG: patatin-like phospholipase family protein [Betaproteobacteria bacterium]